MKKCFRFIGVAMLPLIFLSGCYPTGEQSAIDSTLLDNSSEIASEVNVISSDAVDNVSNRFVNKYLENVEFRYELPAVPNSVPKIKLKIKEWNIEDVKTLFLSDKQISETEENSGGKEYVFGTSDNCSLTVSAGSISFIDSEEGNNSFEYRSAASFYDEVCYASETELTDFPSNDAIKSVDILLGKLGVTNYGEPTVIPITPQMANEYYNNYGGSAKKDGSETVFSEWTEKNGVYVLKYPLVYNGYNISMSRFRVSNSDIKSGGTYITAYVSKDKVFYFKAKDIYDAVCENMGEAQIKYDADNLSNALIDFYSKQVSLQAKTFDKCCLEYIPYERNDWDSRETVFVPALAFCGYSSENLESGLAVMSDNAEYFYADTGARYDLY